MASQLEAPPSGAVTTAGGRAAYDAAFTTLVELYRDRIQRYVLRLVRDIDEAEDLTQETFVRAYRGLASLHDTGALTAWLYRIATRVCYDRFRRASPAPISLDRLRVVEGDGRVETETPRLDLAMERAEMTSCVRGYLDQISDDYRAVILLHDVEGLTGPEVALMLGASLATVKIRLHRARTKLKTALDAGCAFAQDERGVLVCEPRSDLRCK